MDIKQDIEDIEDRELEVARRARAGSKSFSSLCRLSQVFEEQRERDQFFFLADQTPQKAPTQFRKMACE